MKRCPITYEVIPESSRYSRRGLRLLSSRLAELEVIPYSAAEQREEALVRASRISIQGVQPKLSARLNLKTAGFEFVERGGTFILKPPHSDFPALPENEDLTMKLASLVDIETPRHGLCYARDGSLTYFIRRFDRYGRGKKRPLEDFAQLLGQTRDTKYDSSIEKVITVIEAHCSFPLLEKLKLFRRVIFSFLAGNEDMHLKNYSLITRDGKIQLSPAYDLVNSTLVLPRVCEESALPLRGKKRNLTRKDFVHYLGAERLGLNERILNDELSRFSMAKIRWLQVIQESFLPEPLKERYAEIVAQRQKRLEI